MTEITVEGIKLDVSPFGVWFDGRDNFGNSKPEIIQVLEKKQNFLSSLFGSPSLSEIIEQKTSEVKKQDELDQKIRIQGIASYKVQELLHQILPTVHPSTTI